VNEPTSLVALPALAPYSARELAFACRELSEQIEALSGPGSNQLRTLLRRLILAVELREQTDRRLRAEIWRGSEQSQLPFEAVRCALILGVARRHRRTEECQQMISHFAAAVGPGTCAVRTAARHLAVALELYEQDQRRLDSEALRGDQAQ
jgi:hypothetical protein